MGIHLIYLVLQRLPGQFKFLARLSKFALHDARRIHWRILRPIVRDGKHIGTCIFAVKLAEGQKASQIVLGHRDSQNAIGLSIFYQRHSI